LLSLPELIPRLIFSLNLNWSSDRRRKDRAKKRGRRREARAAKGQKLAGKLLADALACSRVDRVQRGTQPDETTKTVLIMRARLREVRLR